MPSIDVSMRRSIRRGILDLLVEGLVKRQTIPSGVPATTPSVNDAASAAAGRTTIPDRVNSVKETFSSWDNCMKASYCKWPVIAGIAVGGLIIFSILWCMIRCCCCGMSCCCTCFSFLKCCDCCGGLCDGKKNRPHKHVDDQFSPSYGGASSGYRPPAAMPTVGGGYSSKPEPPQYAQFEVGKSGLAVDPKPLSEDALPPMPSWQTAQKKHVIEESAKDDVELGQLDPTTGQKVPLMAAGAAPGSSIPPSPMDETATSTPYSARPGQNAQNGYVGVAAGDPYARVPNNVNMGYGAQSNGVANGYSSPPPQDAYGQPTNFVAAAVPNGYNRPQRQNTGDRQFNNNSRNNQYPPQMNRQYTGTSSRTGYTDPSNYSNQTPRGPSRGPGTPMNSGRPPNNNPNYDYCNNASNRALPQDNYSQQQSYNTNNGNRQRSRINDQYYDNASTQGVGYDSRSPQPSQDQQYSGYSSRNQPQSQDQQYSGYQGYEHDNGSSTAHRRDPTAMRPGNGGGGGRREPQGWDPVSNNRY